MNYFVIKSFVKKQELLTHYFKNYSDIYIDELYNIVEHNHINAKQLKFNNQYCILCEKPMRHKKYNFSFDTYQKSNKQYCIQPILLNNTIEICQDCINIINLTYKTFNTKYCFDGIDIVDLLLFKEKWVNFIFMFTKHFML